MATNGRLAFLYLRTLPETQRRDLLASVQLAESQIAPLRGPSAALCRGGLADFAGLDDKTPMKEVPTPPGHVGRTIEVQVDPAKLPPPYIPPAGWSAARAQARAKLPSMLQAMLDLKS